MQTARCSRAMAWPRAVRPSRSRVLALAPWSGPELGGTVLTIGGAQLASAAPLHEGAAKRAEKPHDWKADDQMRVLTQKGKDQCAAAAWFRELDVRAALTSPARRASETAMRMTDRTETEEQKVGSIYLRMVAGVHPAGMSEPCEALFETMGYGPLRVFFEAEAARTCVEINQ